jgi:hypothetical protein
VARASARDPGHHREVLFRGAGPVQAVVDVPGHVGYLAGRYRNGAHSDVWTDVSRCAEGTFVGYAAACTCGWRGSAQPATDVGRVRARREWTAGHLGDVAPAAVPPGEAPLAAGLTAAAPRRAARGAQPVPGRRPPL